MWRTGRVLIVFAHPDDETLACGGEMEHWHDCLIVHTTTGSPNDVSYAQAAGFATQADYAAARKNELDCALALVGGRETRNLGLTDQKSWHNLGTLTEKIRNLIEETKPAAVFTHPYEGGHPDHDAVAFAVQYSCTLLGARAPARVEGAFYNRLGGLFRANEFLPGAPVIEVELDGPTQSRKMKMFDCFPSQRTVLSLFSTKVERFRYAPRYNFTEPPHAGQLNYETLGWGITSKMWLEAARHAEAYLTA